METVELKRCPFCGQEARLTEYVEQVGFGMYDRNHFVTCTYCRSTGRKYGILDGKNEEERIDLAIRAWNRRADDDR